MWTEDGCRQEITDMLVEAIADVYDDVLDRYVPEVDPIVLKRLVWEEVARLSEGYSQWPGHR